MGKMKNIFQFIEFTIINIIIFLKKLYKFLFYLD